MDLESQVKYGGYGGISQQSVRLGFIRKVYGIVCAQVLSTAAMAALCCGPLQPAVLRMVSNHPTLYRWGMLGALLASLLLCHVGKNSYPVNFYGLCFLTAAMAVNVGVICSMVSAAGMGALVVQAALITGGAVAGPRW
eukprot:Skav201609  [mRNA]  locus=scaffold152:1026609:1033838:+ [translate_table: standard]